MSPWWVRPRTGKVDMNKVIDHFSRRCRAVRLVPFDPHLEDGAEIMDRILPVEDEEISVFAKKSFEKQGIKIFTGAKVEKLEKNAESVRATITLKDGKQTSETFDRVILAVGIVGNVENLGLEELGVKIDKSHIVVDEYCRTGVPGHYAIGDVVGPPWLAHKASHEGIVCVEKIAGKNDVHPMKVTNIPGCTYSHPQVASIGLTETAAKANGRERSSLRTAGTAKTSASSSSIWINVSTYQ